MNIEQVRAALDALVSDIECLVDETQGVYGLHQNGDPSPWCDLLPGGRYERLSALDDARAALAAAETHASGQAAPSGATDMAHEIWAAAQLAPGEGIADGTARVEALLSRYGIPAGAALEEAALTDAKDAHFDLWFDDMVVASASGPREQALAEIQHYAAQYAKSGPVEIEEIIRIPLAAIAEHGVK